jgi:hypothetical protein
MVAAVAVALGPASAQNEEPPPPPTPEEIYQSTLDAGLWISEQTLTIPAAAFSISKAVNAMDDRESAAIASWVGVHQTDNVATVLFTVTGEDVVFADNLTTSEQAVCRHLNDGRWWCETDIRTFKIVAAFYLERAPLGGEEQAVAGRPTAAPPR